MNTPLATNTPAPTSWNYWVVLGQLLAGAYPGSLKPKEHHDKVQALLDAGIQTFINLTEEDETGGGGKPFVAYQETVHKLAAVSSTPVSCLRFAIKDLGIPTAERMREILDSIDKSIGTKRPVYLHCWGGVGRTGTTVGCWLLRHGYATKEDVFKVLKQLRLADKERGHRPAPENEAQRAFVMNWREIAI